MTATDRKPVVGEVWTIVRSKWECLKDMGDGDYVWLITYQNGETGTSITDTLGMTPPVTPIPEWMDDDTWVTFTLVQNRYPTYEMADSVTGRAFVTEPVSGRKTAVACCKLDPSTFTWLDGR